MASCPRPGSASDTMSTLHSEVWSGELRSRVTGDLPLPMYKAATGQLLPPPEPCYQKEQPPAWDKGKPLFWPGLGGPGSYESWPFSWVPGEVWELLGLGGARLTVPLFLGTAGFRLPLMLVLSATLTGTAIYQVCPASVPFASGLPSLHSSGPAHCSKRARSPVQRLLTSWQRGPSQRRRR